MVAQVQTVPVLYFLVFWGFLQAPAQLKLVQVDEATGKGLCGQGDRLGFLKRRTRFEGVLTYLIPKGEVDVGFAVPQQVLVVCEFDRLVDGLVVWVLNRKVKVNVLTESSVVREAKRDDGLADTVFLVLRLDVLQYSEAGELIQLPEKDQIQGRLQLFDFSLDLIVENSACLGGQRSDVLSQKVEDGVASAPLHDEEVGRCAFLL